MGIKLTDNEKELLTTLGSYPDISMKELMNHTQYKWVSTVVRKLEQFRKQHLLFGPFHDIDWGRLCRNPFREVYCIVEFNQSHERVIGYLKLIEPTAWIYPVLSSRQKLLHVIFFSSDNAETAALLQLLKDHDIITDYVIRIFNHRRVIENPNFFGDSNPSLDNLLTPCDAPDFSFGCHDTNWNECDISILPYLYMGFYHKGGKLIEILKSERNLNKTWTYSQVNYSREKMLKNGLIRKIYVIFPFQFEQCADFNLFLRTEDAGLMQGILHNFARGSRVHRGYTLCEDWGYINFTSHPRFLTDLMNKLDKIDEITEKELYHVRSVPTRRYFFVQPPELKYFDFERQTVEYPYHVYREKIKEKIENETM